jgi:hypothetical protein
MRRSKLGSFAEFAASGSVVDFFMKELTDMQHHPAPVVTPQALAWHGNELWMSSRDLGTLQRIDVESWKIVEELDPPGVVWAAVRMNDGWRFTVGKGLNDDRHVYSYRPEEGFRRLFACPDFTGSYLSYDGKDLYLSQWYKGLILQLDSEGKTQREIAVEAEICGHTFVEGTLYVLRGHENNQIPDTAEEWRIARLDPRQERPQVEDLAVVPFACRSLTFDGRRFWSNHRAANETVSFTLAI